MPYRCIICDKIIFQCCPDIRESHYVIQYLDKGIETYEDPEINFCKECFTKVAGKHIVELIKKSNQ